MNPPPGLEQAVLARNGTREGEEIRFRCPYPVKHANGDANPSARFHPGKAAWTCDVCGEGGGWKDLAQLLGVTRPERSARKPQVLATYPYRDESGTILRRKLRWEPGFEGRSKSFSWEKPEGDGWVNCKGDGNPKVLYGSEKLPEARKSRQTVFVVEGEKDADRGAALGLLTVCNPEGASSGRRSKWRASYSDQLRALPVVVVPDKDAPGRAHARAIAASLSGKVHSLKLLDLPGERVKDLSDWIATLERSEFDQGDIRQRLEALAEAAEFWTPGDERELREEQDRRHKPKQAEILLQLAEGTGIELFHCPEKTAYVTLPVSGHHETWLVSSKSFRLWLHRAFYHATNQAPAPQALQSALSVLESRALFDGDTHEVSVRVAGGDGVVYLDLCNEVWELVEVTAKGWRIVPESPVKFRRTGAMLSLPRPVRGGSVRELGSLVNLPDEDSLILFVAFLVAALRPKGPYPALVLQGEQGSAKSTAARLARRLVDPAYAPLRTAPRDERDLMITAACSWMPVFDNLSRIPTWLSDSLCRLATGGGFSTRRLYTNDEETIFSAMRPMILNGIDDIVSRQDLADRSLLLRLPPIPDSERKTEKELDAAFEAARPRLLGALLDAVSCALRNQGAVRLSSKPRMADFATWVLAAEPALPWASGCFLEAYTGNRADAVELALEADVVAVAVRELIEIKGTFQGTAKDLLADLEGHVGDRLQKSRAWPKSPRGLSAQLTRCATFLRQVGLEVTQGQREGGTGKRLIRIEKGGVLNRHNRHDRHTIPKHGELDGDGCDGRLESVTFGGDDRHGAIPIESGRCDGCDGRDGCDAEIPSVSEPREVVEL